MKMKKIYIFLLILIILLPTLIFVLKKNNIEISEVFNQNNKLATYEFSEKNSCDAWIDINTINNSDIILKDGNYLIIDATYTNLAVKDSNGNITYTGYEGFAYIKDGCAVPMESSATYSGFLDSYNNNTNVCNKIKYYITDKRSKEDAYNWNYWAEIYNGYVDKGYCSDKITLETITDAYECSEEEIAGGEIVFQDDGYKIINAKGTKLPAKNASGNIVNSGYEGFAFVLENGCTTGVTDFFSKYSNKTNGCSAMKTYVETNISSLSAGNIYYYNYWVKQYNNICPNNKLNEKKEIDCSTRQSIVNNNNVELAQKYNSICKDEEGFTEIKFSTITMDWQDGWGPQTLNGWNGTYGVYYITGIINDVGGTNKVTVQFDNALKDSSQLYHLIGWDKDSSCNDFYNPESYPEKGYANSSHTFTFENTDATYYACYNGDIDHVELFNGDIAKNGVEYSVMEQNACSTTSVVSNSLTQVPMKTLNRYIRREFKPLEIEKTINASKGTSEQKYYCNVMCTDIVDVNYPNIFETVPAGQYFELMYEPEITATRSCQTEFRYSKWDYDYRAALTAEKTALENLSEAQAYYDAAKDMSYDDTDDCGCCGEEDCNNCGTYYEGTDYATYVDLGGTKRVVSVTVTASTCSGESWSGEQGDEEEEREETLKAAEIVYRNAVQHRINLENINLQCYTVLDSDKSNNSTDSIKYNSVITESDSNTYEYQDNSLVIDDSFKYTTKTSIVNLDTNNYGTKDYDYLNYIKQDTTANVSSISQITDNEMKLQYSFNKTNYQKNTKQFYYLRPQITFSYNDGYSLDPNLDNNEVNISETLQVEPHVKLDTGSYTDENSGVYTKNNSTTSYDSGTFSLEYTKNTGTCETEYACYSKVGTIHNGNKITFNGYNTQKTFRTVKYYFTFHEATEYFSEIQSGLIDIAKQNDNYTSLSKRQYINSKILQSHVYPVSLNAVNGNYAISFKLSDNMGYLEEFKETESKKFSGNYICQYEITNDALTLKNEAIKNYKDLKSNTIFRSVALDNIDPNYRADTGNLGENWINPKGSAVRALIKSKETHDGVSKDTYNSNNLEYSFTLTPSLINAIKSYNDDPNRTYNDFNLTCATEDNRECESEFLTELYEGKVNGVEILDNYSEINPWRDLSATRKKWKYFTGENIEILEQTTKYDIAGDLLSNSQAMSLVEYQNLYETWGVLP